MSFDKYRGMKNQCPQCKSRCWVLEVGKGMLSRVVAHSNVGCIRHDRGAYNAALLDLEPHEARRLRYAADLRRWRGLHPAL